MDYIPILNILSSYSFSNACSRKRCLMVRERSKGTIRQFCSTFEGFHDDILLIFSQYLFYGSLHPSKGTIEI